MKNKAIIINDKKKGKKENKNNHAIIKLIEMKPEKIHLWLLLFVFKQTNKQITKSFKR